MDVDARALGKRRLSSEGAGLPAPEIRLTDTERRLFGVVRSVAQALTPSPVPRVAGGWVRDKLLLLDSDDIDIALDNMTGATFAEHINEHLRQHDVATHRVGVIKRNPEQSKHLETAKVQLFDYWVDFVNLRSETYNSDSRIPDVSFGTPEQDALRRDITINALFYNIITEQVEDFTGKGWDDLRNGAIRTPLDPKTTFMDDPLRMLRVIRFATRFQFNVDPKTWQGLQDREAQHALGEKVSRERIGIEIDKMMRGAKPDRALDMLYATKLDKVVFGENVNVYSPPRSFVDNLSPLLDEDERRLVILALALWRIRGEQVQDKKGKSTSKAATIVRDMLKLPVKDADAVALIHELEPMWQALQAPYSRLELGKLLRKAGPLWRASLMYADANGPVRWLDVKGAVYHMGLQDVWNMRPLLDGGQVAALLGLPKGPAIGALLQELLEWQLEHPRATEADARAYLLERKGVS